MSLRDHMADARALHARALAVDLLGDADVVHDLRVALRRCRSLAQGLAVVDVTHADAWRTLARTARGLFDGLGALRDRQVMCEWAALVPESVRAAVVARLAAPLPALVADARRALVAFDTAAWDDLTTTMPALAEQALRRRPLLLHLAIARYDEARALHVLAMRRRDPESLHRTRVGVKRLRYTLESLLPDVYDDIARPLKKMQELLGELHDLDVLLHALADLEPDALAGVRAARAERLAEYKAMATGRGAWTAIRRILPSRPLVVFRCRRAYVLEVAASLGVDGRSARAAERIGRAIARARGEAWSETLALAVLLAPARRKRARRSVRRMVGFADAERRALDDAVRHSPIVRAVRRLARTDVRGSEPT